MDTKKYNGWKNRSTWLAKLHLDNDSLTVFEMAQRAGVEANTLKQFKYGITRVLTQQTTVEREQEFKLEEVDFNELWDAFRITK